jgi:CBS domain-containing protein
VGWFLLRNAGQAAQYATVQSQLSDLTAADAVLATSPVVADSLSLREFADQQILSEGNWRRFLVTNQAGQLVGAVSLDDLSSVGVENWSDTVVGALTRPIQQTVASDRPLLEVVKLLEQDRLSALPVIGQDGVLVGLLEKASILNLLQSRLQTNPA